MKEAVVLVAIAVLGVLTFGLSAGKEAPQLGKATFKRVIAAMTLEEKACFVTGTGMTLPGEKKAQDDKQTPGAPVVGETQKTVPGAAGTTHEIPHLGIRPMVMADGPAGLRISPTRAGDKSTYYCTAFPVATLLASTWDPDLVYKVGQAMGNEVLEYGADILLGPGLNLHRNPLCGRNFEYYSEDPLVIGKIAAAMVNGVESNGVGTSIKHFAANNAETNRNALNTIVSERALRELYLEGFRIAVQDAQPWTVMSSYNLINNIHASENFDLLTKVLREDWGFKGFVMTDWFGGIDAVAQMKAGNDLIMPGSAAQAKAIIAAVREKKLDESVLDRNIERIMSIMVQSPRFKGYRYSNKPDLKAHALVARRAAAEGMILLKNNGAALPFASSIKTLAAFGNTSYEIIAGGTGSGDVNEAYSVSLVEGLKDAGFGVEPNLQKAYTDYIQAARKKNPPARQFALPVPVDEMSINAELAKKMAEATDGALITIGRNSGEGADRKIEGDFNLSAEEKNLIRTVVDAFHAKGKKAVVALNIGGVIETVSWRDLPDAILLTWQGGQEAGHSIADVLSGKVNPSGKLASTFPIQYADVSSAKNFPGVVVEPETPLTNREDNDMLSVFRRPKKSRVVYEEGIYVGYRYYQTFDVKPAYEFGYGLSYTTFDYSGLALNSITFFDKLMAAVTVKNTGKVAGKEVVQLHLSAPAKKLDKPEEELKGFVKTRLLQPGESQTISFTITPRNLSSFDTASSSWVAEAGTYEVRVGASSKDIRQKAAFTLNKELMVNKENKALAPPSPIDELKPKKQ
jgi:beta-glucosidase